jgi:cytochrome c551/c552
VKRTLDSNCVACHNEQKTAGAPMSLKTYADTQAPALSDPSKKVFQVMGVRVHDTKSPMPPQTKLTDAQLKGIDGWIAAQAPAGADPTCAANAAPETPTDGWEWPTNCDATYKLLSHGDGGTDSPFSVQAGQEVHPQVALTAPWGSEPVQMIAWRAITDNPKVLHHWILYGAGREHLVGWAPGKDHNAPLPPEVGLDLPGGSFTLDMHYNNLQGSGTEQDHSGVEVCVLKKEHFRAKTAGVYTRFTTLAINIPAHATNFDVTATCNVTMSQPVTLLTASPHAHTLANHMKFTVQRASGETELMHEGPFSFDEQGSYELKTPLDLKEGDKVITTCTYSNPTDKTITFGENTGNEMCFNFAVYYPLNALTCSGGFAGPAFPQF